MLLFRQRLTYMKKIIVVSSFVGLILFGLNIIIPLFWAENAATQIVVAVLSGWVSGIATLLIGVIALYQSEKYNKSSDLFLNKQYKLEKCKSIIQSRLMFVDNLKKAWNTFRESANSASVRVKLKSIIDSTQYLSKNIAKDRIDSEIRLPLRADCSALSTVVKCDYRKSNEREKAIDKLSEYRELFNSIFSKENINGDLTFISSGCNSKLVHAYIDLVHAFDDYVQQCDIDINEAITKRCDDYDCLASDYSVDNKPVL